MTELTPIQQNLCWLAEHPEYTTGAYSVDATPFCVRIQGRLDDVYSARHLLSRFPEASDGSRRFTRRSIDYFELAVDVNGVAVRHIADTPHVCIFEKDDDTIRCRGCGRLDVRAVS